jgi:hypothetical protein
MLPVRGSNRVVMRQKFGTTHNLAAECRQSEIAWDGVTDNSDTVAPGERGPDARRDDRNRSRAATE